MKNYNLKKVKGYIEGYYGNLLTWDERDRIINILKKNRMNFYFYCPKEDLFHRYEWKKQYTNEWLKSFKNFSKNAHSKKIKIICGIAPGLNFNFQNFFSGYKSELKLLEKKCLKFVKNGADGIAIMFDDIPFDCNNKISLKDEGLVHAKLVNLISSKFNLPVFTVPRIYADELVNENSFYLETFLNELDKKVYVFYSGEYIVSQKFSSKLKILKQKLKKGKIIYWDNFYANDYCPKRLIIGPWKNKYLINKSMINGTGLINTDELILEIVNKTGNKKNKYTLWKNILKKHHVPKYFFHICKAFLAPNFSYQTKLQKYQFNHNSYFFLDYLLWKWKSELSREWYNYFLNFKHDLQILNDELPVNRILKTQTNPFQMVLLERKYKNE